MNGEEHQEHQEAVPALRGPGLPQVFGAGGALPPFAPDLLRGLAATEQALGAMPAGPGDDQDDDADCEVPGDVTMAPVSAVRLTADTQADVFRTAAAFLDGAPQGLIAVAVSFGQVYDGAGEAYEMTLYLDTPVPGAGGGPDAGRTAV